MGWGKVVMGRAKRGLFDGKHIRFGNKVSHSNRRSRRSWKPNVQVKHYYSEVLGETLRLKVTSSAMRTIDKYGGFDNYILKAPKYRLGSWDGLGAELRERMNLNLVLAALDASRPDAAAAPAAAAEGISTASAESAKVSI